MRVFRGLPKSSDAALALTIGNFDGVHRGHQAMLARLIEGAEDLRLVPAVLTFEPHPREFFAPATAPPRLSSLRAKLETFRAFGVAQTIVARFDARLASLSAEAFVHEVLEKGLNARWVLVGDDFRFGKGRQGDIALLRSKARQFSVEGMRTVALDGERASSTAIRAALANGDLAHAAQLLGRPFSIAGRVAHGDKLGRSLGFPTANVPLKRKPPLTGVKADARPLLEVSIFDFDDAIYGRRIAVEFLHKLRDEERYADLPALTRQIRADAEQARAFFANEDACPTTPRATTSPR